jgi:nucleoside-diphosphate-sugar epimerase
MKVAVSGASGFIGRALCAALGRDVTPIPRNGAIPAPCDAIVHLAGIAHRSAAEDEYEAVNVRYTEQLARQAAAVGAHFVFMSSVKVHGEESVSPLTERSPIQPRDPYGRSKARAEERLHAIAGLKLTVLRPPLVYGAGVKANFLALMRAVARGWPLPLASIENRRSLVYVGNLVDAIRRSIGTPGTFLVSDGEPISTPALCRELGAALGRPARLFPFPPALLPGKLARSLEIDDSAIRTALGWQPPTSREAALKATAQWYRSA